MFSEDILDIKKYLDKKSKKQLVSEICRLSNKIPMVKEYYSNLLGKSDEVLEKFKRLIKQEYFPSKGFGDARAGIIRKIISDFKKIAKSNTDLIELLVYHVEQGVKYTNEFGDIDERFYSSIERSFESALILIKKEKLFEEYQERCFKIFKDTDGIGWGFHDCLGELHYSTFKNG
jgi:hypothetical protein